MNKQNCSLIVFTRKPALGKVKTRIQKTMGADMALAIHTQLLTSTLQMASNVDGVSYCVSCSPDCDHPIIDAYEGACFIQSGDDLGERMMNALRQQLQHYQYCILIGTDCPQIDSAYINQAFQELKNGNDIVLGPASDGGYVLVGMGQVFSGMFNNIDWGTGRVLEQTMAIIQAHDKTSTLLPVLRDIDDEDDWRWWQGL